MDLYCLNEPVSFDSPVTWAIQARCALAYKEGEAFIAPADTLVIYLGGSNTDEAPHAYRLADGRVGILQTSPDERFTAVEDQQVLGLARQVTDLPELLRKKGLHLCTPSRLEPFTLIRCPMCGAAEFVTVDHASVWCDQCNTRFQTRSTAGDPGVVVDAHMDHYDRLRADYIVPRSLTATLVIKDFGYSSHADGVYGDYCANSDEEASVPSGLRPSVAPCGLEVYDWSLYGAPGVRGGRCPLYAQGEVVCLDDRVYSLKSVHSSRLPSVDWLGDGEFEERERWCLVDGLPHSESREGWYAIWWKVRSRVEESYGRVSLTGWDVVDRTLCPRCLEPAAVGDHSFCNWHKLGWKPRKSDGLERDRHTRE